MECKSLFMGKDERLEVLIEQDPNNDPWTLGINFGSWFKYALVFTPTTTFLKVLIFFCF
jgi:hypothetical protein